MRQKTNCEKSNGVPACPHCGRELSVMVVLGDNAELVRIEVEAIRGDTADGLREEIIMREVRRREMLDVFREIMMRAAPHLLSENDNDIRKAFIYFCGAVIRKWLPREAFDALRKEFDGGSVKVFTAYGIEVVLSRGAIVAFSLGRQNGGQKHQMKEVRISKNERRWVHRTLGYVLEGGALYEERSTMRRFAGHGAW